MSAPEQPPEGPTTKRGISDRALLITLIAVLLIPLVIAFGLWWSLYDMFEFVRIPGRPV